MKQCKWVVFGRVSVMFLMALGCFTASASETREYCNEMYPAESYEPDERQQYISECLQSYGESETETTTQTDDEGYYNGTVEEFVDSTSNSE